MAGPRAAVRAVFFDSGGTLTQPLRERWWPKPGFPELAIEMGLTAPHEDAAGSALREGHAHLYQHPYPATLDEEVGVYLAVYRIVLGRLYGTYPMELADRLAHAAVFELDQKPFEDTLPTLDRLDAMGLDTAIVSNAAPSLHRRYLDMRIRDRFDPFVLSAIVRSEKPDRAIYYAALNLAGRSPHEVVFVDDVAANVVTAVAIGMDALLIDRSPEPNPPPGITIIRHLGELITWLDGGPFETGSRPGPGGGMGSVG